MMDKIIVFIAMVALVAFCGVVVGFVAEPDLVIVVALVLALASHDFWISVFRKEQPSTLEAGGELKERYTAVSGKPLETAKELERDAERSTSGKNQPRSKKAPAKSRRTKK